MKPNGDNPRRCALRSILTLVILVVTAAQAAMAGGIYKGVDAEGNVHFGDRRMTGFSPEHFQRLYSGP